MKTTLPLSLFLFTILAPLFLFSGCASNARQPAATLAPAPAPVTQLATPATPAGPAATPAATLATPAGPALALPVTTTVTPPDANRVTYDYTQHLYAPTPGSTMLAPQRHAADIINAFKPIYAKLNNPRILIYTNRDLLGQAQPTVTTAPAPSGHGIIVTPTTITDRQTTRDIERIAARPFRYAGATLIDPQTATAPDTTREDLAKLADLAIEILVSSRDISIPNTTNGANTYAIPDIQMTAIRLSDSAILGQATSADITNPLPAAALGTLNVQDVLEATALNLMTDITTTAK